MSDYFHKILIPFVDRLVEDYMAIADNEYQIYFDSIGKDEKELFASHLLMNDGGDLSCIVDCDEHKEIGNILILTLKRPNTVNKIDFAEFIMEKVVNYYKYSMSMLLLDRLDIIKKNYNDKTCIVSYL